MAWVNEPRQRSGQLLTDSAHFPTTRLPPGSPPVPLTAADDSRQFCLMNRRDFNAIALSGAATAFLRHLTDRRRSTGPSVNRSTRPQPDLRVNADRISAHLAALARIRQEPTGRRLARGVQRRRRAARAEVMDWMRAAKLEPSIDFAGNIIGRRAGSDASLKPLLFGSHIDSVPEGGNYDGQVGSTAAIEVAQTLAEHNVVTRHPLEVVIWQNEEGGLYRQPRGERPAQRRRAQDRLEQRQDDRSRESRFIGGDRGEAGPGQAAEGRDRRLFRAPHRAGRHARAEKIDIGVVEGIVGIKQWDVTVTGFANHAGTTAMDQRHDALLSAARFVDMVNRVVRGIPGRQVGTVGRIQAFPGAPNVIPGKVVCTLELRDLDDAKIDSMFARIRAEADAIGKQNGTQFAFAELHVNVAGADRSAHAHDHRRRGGALGLSTRVMPSGAGSRRTGDGAARADRDDLHPERRRHQPFAERVLAARGHRERRKRPVAIGARRGQSS